MLISNRTSRAGKHAGNRWVEKRDDKFFACAEVEKNDKVEKDNARFQGDPAVNARRTVVTSKSSVFEKEIRANDEKDLALQIKHWVRFAELAG